MQRERNEVVDEQKGQVVLLEVNCDLSRSSTFLITPYNTKLKFLGTWHEAAPMTENKHGVVEVQYEYLHEHMGTLTGAKAFTLYYVWYHFNYTVPIKGTNMRDKPTEYSAWNLAKFLQELKRSGVGTRAIGDLHMQERPRDRVELACSWDCCIRSR